MSSSILTASDETAQDRFFEVDRFAVRLAASCGAFCCSVAFAALILVPFEGFDNCTYINIPV